ncbi:MAG: SPOR domain-containing protein [Magnetococcales bacterium]|nr:SPOR domain-containing protein [Magnetococcales bacterium]
MSKLFDQLRTLQATRRSNNRRLSPAELESRRKRAASARNIMPNQLVPGLEMEPQVGPDGAMALDVQSHGGAVGFDAMGMGSRVRQFMNGDTAAADGILTPEYRDPDGPGSLRERLATTQQRFDALSSKVGDLFSSMGRNSYVGQLLAERSERKEKKAEQSRKRRKKRRPSRRGTQPVQQQAREHTLDPAFDADHDMEDILDLGAPLDLAMESDKAPVQEQSVEPVMENGKASVQARTAEPAMEHAVEPVMELSPEQGMELSSEQAMDAATMPREQGAEQPLERRAEEPLEQDRALDEPALNMALDMELNAELEEAMARVAHQDEPSFDDAPMESSATTVDASLGAFGTSDAFFDDAYLDEKEHVTQRNEDDFDDDFDDDFEEGHDEKAPRRSPLEILRQHGMAIGAAGVILSGAVYATMLEEQGIPTESIRQVSVALPVPGITETEVVDGSGGADAWGADTASSGSAGEDDDSSGSGWVPVGKAPAIPNIAALPVRRTRSTTATAPARTSSRSGVGGRSSDSASRSGSSEPLKTVADAGSSKTSNHRPIQPPNIRPLAVAATMGSKPMAGKGYMILAGTYKNPDSAFDIRKKLEGIGAPVFVKRVREQGRVINRVQVGPFGSEAEARALIASVERTTRQTPRILVTDAAPEWGGGGSLWGTGGSSLSVASLDDMADRSSTASSTPVVSPPAAAARTAPAIPTRSEPVAARAPVQSLSPQTPPPSTTAAVNGAVSAAGTRFTVLSGSFSSRRNAERVQQQLAENGVFARVVTTTVNGRTFNRVQAGPYGNEQEALQVEATIKRRTSYPVKVIREVVPGAAPATAVARRQAPVSRPAVAASAGHSAPFLVGQAPVSTPRPGTVRAVSSGIAGTPRIASAGADHSVTTTPADWSKLPRGYPRVQPGHYLVFVGSYTDMINAGRIQRILAGHGIPVRLKQNMKKGRPYIHVQVGPFSKDADAQFVADHVYRKTTFKARAIRTRSIVQR